MLAGYLVEQAADHGCGDAPPPVGTTSSRRRRGRRCRHRRTGAEPSPRCDRRRERTRRAATARRRGAARPRSARCRNGPRPDRPWPAPSRSPRASRRRRRHPSRGSGSEMPFLASAARTRASISSPSDSNRDAMSSTAAPSPVGPILPSNDRSTFSWIPAASRAPRSSKRRAMSCSRSAPGGLGASRRGCVLFRRDRNLSALEPVDRDLEDALGLVDPAEMALSEREHRDAVGQPGAEERARRLREEDLTAAAHRADARRSHDVEPDVALLVHGRLARVQPHPHANGRRRRTTSPPHARAARRPPRRGHHEPA